MVSNSEGSFAGLATYVLVCWAIMVSLLLNMSYLTMAAMHGKAATWVGPSDPSLPPPKKKIIGGTEATPLKRPGITTYHLSLRIFKTSYGPVVEDGRATTAAPLPVGGGGGGDNNVLMATQVLEVSRNYFCPSKLFPGHRAAQYVLSDLTCSLTCASPSSLLLGQLCHKSSKNSWIWLFW